MKKTFTRYLELAQTVYDIAYRWIVKKESLLAKEKIVSILEEHTDIIVFLMLFLSVTYIFS